MPPEPPGSTRSGDAMTTDAPDRLRQLHTQLENAFTELVSGDDWRRMLNAATRFHHYSPANVILILRQRPDATRVAGYRTWQTLGRQVRRGQRGIAILAPCTYKAGGDDESDSDDEPAACCAASRSPTSSTSSRPTAIPSPTSVPPCWPARHPPGYGTRWPPKSPKQVSKSAAATAGPPTAEPTTPPAPSLCAPT